MKEIFLVGAGGMIGSISRMIILKLNIYNISLPLNTFLVNIIGCFIVGILIKYSAGVSKEIAEYLNYFLIIGFCGGFTTFSAYSVDSLNLLNEDKIIMFLIYSVLSSVIGILFCYLGSKNLYRSFGYPVCPQ